MHRQVYAGAIVLVEGDSDSRYFSNIYRCKVVFADGKSNALSVLDILEGEGYSGIVCIVDADFWHLDGNIPKKDNVLITDTHDLETMMLQTQAFDKLISEYKSSIGYLRWVSERLKLKLDFKDLDFGKFVDRRTWAVDQEKMLHLIIKRSKIHMDQKAVIIDELDELHKQSPDVWQICSGHDLLNMLSVGLKTVLGTHDSKSVDHDVLARSLRLAYERNLFEKTRLYGELRQWEQNNAGYSIF
jgi:hypothetical protein